MTRYSQCDDTCTTDCGHCKGNGPPVARILPVAPDLTAEEAATVARFEAAPYPAEVLLSHLNTERQHRMDPDCWCAPVNVGQDAWQHNEERQ